MAGSTRQQQKDATAQRLFEVAMNLFMTKGYEATTVDAITAAAGVAKGTFFVHFPSKQAVVAHFGRMQMARLAAVLAADTALQQLPFRQQIQSIFQTLGAGVASQREIVQIVASELFRTTSVRQEEASNISDLDALLVPFVQVAQQRGQLRNDHSADRLASMIRNVYLMSVLEWLGSDQEPFIDLAIRSLNLVLEGLEP
jgi:AcrR family transcriptional regulator